jgi:hypothetical protein
MQSKTIVSWILRISLAFAFAFPAINAIFDSGSWVGYFPSFLSGYADPLIMLHAFGAFELALALWVLSGWKVQIPAAIMALMLLAIVMFNLAQFQILFRDFAILGEALALMVMQGAKRPRRGVAINLEA